MRRLRIALLATLVVALSSIGLATTIDLPSWEELVLEADLVGVLECEVAGDAVGKFRVVDRWKGPPGGRSITLRISTSPRLPWSDINEPDPQLPAPLCGERYLVIASKVGPLPRNPAIRFHLEPITWRRISCDYVADAIQGFTPVAGNTFNNHLLTANDYSVAGFKRDVQALTNLPAGEQETQLLKIRAKRFGTEIVQQSISDAKDVNGIVEICLKDKTRGGHPGLILKGGGEITLSALERLHSMDPRGPDANWREEIVQIIRRRLGRTDQTNFEGEITPKSRTKQELDSLRASMNLLEPSWEAANAMAVLSVHDPQFVAERLITWTMEPSDRANPYLGYSLASHFAWRCGDDRKENLTKLVFAKDPFIRVAGAVYLCFEDIDRGLRDLKLFSELEGDPGAWAALTRARRGDKAAVPRALRVFVPLDKSLSGKYGTTESMHLNLQRRVKVLLSNSAKASGVDQPVHLWRIGYGSDQDQIYQSYHSWWKANESRLTLSDPWLPLLTELKLD